MNTTTLKLLTNTVGNKIPATSCSFTNWEPISEIRGLSIGRKTIWLWETLKPQTHGNILLANICVTQENIILLNNSMAEMADSADDDDVAAAVICLIARKRKRRRPKSVGNEGGALTSPNAHILAVINYRKQRWRSVQCRYLSRMAHAEQSSSSSIYSPSKNEHTNILHK